MPNTVSLVFDQPSLFTLPRYLYEEPEHLVIRLEFQTLGSVTRIGHSLRVLAQRQKPYMIHVLIHDMLMQNPTNDEILHKLKCQGQGHRCCIEIQSNGNVRLWEGTEGLKTSMYRLPDMQVLRSMMSG